MPRNASGNYTLPAGNPVVTGTTIASTWANTTLDDLKTEVTDSLSRSGKGGMLAPLALVDGAVGAPALAFTSELSTGLYRPAASALALVVGSSELLRVSNTGAEPAHRHTSLLAAASAQTDFTFVVATTPTAFRSIWSVSDAQSTVGARLTSLTGQIVLRGTAPGLQSTDTANAPLTLYGNRAAADAGTDVILSSAATRTAGNLLDVQNNGVSKFKVQFDGVIALPGTPTLAATAANSSLTLKGNRSAADAGADAVVSSTATRTAGNLLDVQNNGTSRFQVDFAGNLLLSTPTSPALIKAVAVVGIEVRGNQTAGSGAADVEVSSSVTRTAGNLLDVQNNGTSKAQVDYLGNAHAQNLSQRLYITADQSTSSTTPTNMTNFAVTVAANADYLIELDLIIGTPGTGNWVLSITAPAAVTILSFTGAEQSGTGPWAYTLKTGSSSSFFTVQHHVCLLRNGANAGTVQFLMNSGTAGQTIVLKQGSALRWSRMDSGGFS